MGGGGVKVIYNPNKNPIKLEENRCSLNVYTFYKKTTLNRYAGLQPGVNHCQRLKKCMEINVCHRFQA